MISVLIGVRIFRNVVMLACDRKACSAYCRKAIMKTMPISLLQGFVFIAAQAQSGPNIYDDVEEPVMNVRKFEWCRGECDRNHQNLGK
jgi:hypothetical protein